MKRVLTFALVFASFALAPAQDMGPPPELKKLEWWLGEWTGKIKWEMPGMPETEDVTTMKSEMMGSFIKTTSTMKAGEMVMDEVAYTAWDAKNQRYTMWTFTNFAPAPRIDHGTLDGDKFVSVCEPWDVPGMGPIVARATMVKKNDKESTFMLEFKSGDDWMKVAQGSMTKKGA